MKSQPLTGRPFRIALLVASLLIALLALWIWWAVGSVLPRHAQLPIEQIPDAQPKQRNGTIRVATYNIAHGQGFKTHASDWRDENHTRKKMHELTDAVKVLNADIVFLQEVDLDSNRTHHIDEAKWLVEGARYPYWACAPVWDKNYIPFPFLGHHIGQVKTANCILSRYPLSGHKRLVFDKPMSHPIWYSWGYIDRGAQHVVAQVGEKTVILVNVHFEAWDKQARKKQAHDLLEWIKNMPGPLILGGDFNAVPSEASQKANFDDEPETTYEDDETIRIIRDGLIDEIEAINPTQHEQNEKETLTFPSHHPTRRLDHIFAINGAKILSGRVVTEAKDASDHLPVEAEIVLQ